MTFEAIKFRPKGLPQSDQGDFWALQGWCRAGPGQLEGEVVVMNFPA